MCDVSTNSTNSTSDIDQFYDCLKERTFTRDEILFESYFKDKKGIRTLDVEWNNLFQNIEFGTCQTALIQEQIESPQNYLIINLNSSLNYRVFLHDPKVFFMSVNSKAFHRTEIRVPHGTGLTQLIEATQYKLFSRKTFQCEEEESYNFSACVEQKMDRMTGCRVGQGNLPVREIMLGILLQLFDNSDSGAGEELEPCENMTQFYSFMTNWNIIFFEDNEKIVK